MHIVVPAARTGSLRLREVTKLPIFLLVIGVALMTVLCVSVVMYRRKWKKEKDSAFPTVS